MARDLGVVSDQNDGRAAAIQVPQQVEDALAGDRVETARRLVGEDQSRPVRKRARHCNLLLLAARQPARAHARPSLQADELQQTAGARPALLRLDAGKRQREDDVLFR